MDTAVTQELRQEIQGHSVVGFGLVQRQHGAVAILGLGLFKQTRREQPQFF
jgi:hypothetical protein